MSVAAKMSLNAQDSGQAAHCNPQESDDGLVAAAKTGDKAAFNQLCERHSEKVFRVTHRITRNREDAEDAVQEAFLNAFIHLKSFDGRSRFSTWLTRIAMNAALMILRKKSASRERPMQESIEASEIQAVYGLADRSLNPEDRYAQTERDTILKDLVAKLRPSIRKAVEIRYIGECSLHETAEVLGISVMAAKARLFHARAALRGESQMQFVIPGFSTESEPGLRRAS
jgi:RNA polymerase sigma-70 factor (ECF subfamily)